MLKPAAGAAAFSGQLAADSDASTMLASYAAQQPSLSIVKGWDALNLLAAPMRRRKGQARRAKLCLPLRCALVLKRLAACPCTFGTHPTAPLPNPLLPVQQKVDRRPESGGAAGTKRERCVGVEAYWRQLEPHQRRQLMRAPLGKMVEGVYSPPACCAAIVYAGLCRVVPSIPSMLLTRPPCLPATLPSAPCSCEGRAGG
jgi:hypothetical protein